MLISNEDYYFLQSGRWLGFLECTAVGLRLNLTVISFAKNIKLQSSGTCPVCHQPYQDLFPVFDQELINLQKIQETIDLKSKDTALILPLGTDFFIVAQECFCLKETYPNLKERAVIAAKLLSNFLTSFSQEYNSGQRALELSILRQMNYLVLSLFQGDPNALQRSFELILSALIIILEAEGSWVQLESGCKDIFIKGDEFQVKSYLNKKEGFAEQIDISFGQFKCNLGVLTPFNKKQAAELISLMAQECAIILEIDNLFKLLNKQLAKVLGAVNSAILVIDQRKNITYANQAAETLFDKLSVNLIGASIANIDGPWAQLLETDITSAINGKMELLGKARGEDNPCWIDWELSPILEETAIVGWLVIADDRSDYYRWQSVARRAERFAATSMLLGTLAHELRNPLSAAKGLLQLMSRKRDPERTRGYADLVLREIDRVTSLLNEFLLLGKPAAILPESLDIVRFIRDLMPLLEGEAIGTTIEVLFNSSEKAAPVMADPGQLTQVILNLVRNAVQSLGQTGIVEILLCQQNDNVEIIVQDNGPGFAPGVIEQLFTPFFTTKERGTGLGLPVVKTIINNHDGEIEACNLPQGGAVFTIKLPIARLTTKKDFDVVLIVKDKILNYSLLQTLKSLAYIVKDFELNDFLNGISADLTPKLVIFEGLFDDINISMEELIRKRPGMNILVLGDLPQKEVDFTQAKGLKIMDRPFEIDRIISAIKELFLIS
jgi:Signal transduction histidine kinase, nitrogen specific